MYAEFCVNRDAAGNFIRLLVNRRAYAIHNAGHMVFGPAEAFTPEQLAELYDINAFSTQRVNRIACSSPARAEMKPAAGHPFDGENGAGANRTAQLDSDLGMSCAALCTEQSTAAREHTASPAVGEKSEVANADQALGQDVDQEPAQKLIGIRIKGYWNLLRSDGVSDSSEAIRT